MGSARYFAGSDRCCAEELQAIRAVVASQQPARLCAEALLAHKAGDRPVRRQVEGLHAMSTVSKTPVGRPVAVPFTEQKKFIVDVSGFSLSDDKHPGKYVPADFFAELIRKEIMKE